VRLPRRGERGGTERGISRRWRGRPCLPRSKNRVGLGGRRGGEKKPPCLIIIIRKGGDAFETPAAGKKMISRPYQQITLWRERKGWLAT